MSPPTLHARCLSASISTVADADVSSVALATTKDSISLGAVVVKVDLTESIGHH